MKTNAYLIDTEALSIGFDLSSWALPVMISFGRCNLYVQVLCLDISIYWGESHG